ncbi:MAG: TIM barrel protein [Flavobacteriales bacterium]|nr:TIM barrel protein [Flavobacteriia bacterium]NCP51454.1 TIM barrel protein [Flavobacteriales bacterium]PIV94047.1 MAG: xylose isomerase [Flavobacteriaceae bacterium CG17_big_fil_post_rev_8_21_14_2_50_33_15]PIY10951.1 MAG: xylose isomerase [Flavobacteriaceae bacterium CG_4_10_14_3_um_filter_33_47]PJB20034.1 MAG: xylose isomerase [Flavobacteriaceae bacterium CG_4_9_14_3_um_filter_33_16]
MNLSRKAPQVFFLLFLFLLVGCVNSKKKETKEIDTETKTDTKPFFKWSLAQWSLHKFVIEEQGDPFQFASMAKDMGFEGLEYVSGLYSKQIEVLGFDKTIDSLKTMSQLSGMSNVLIMVDGEGDLADPDEVKRNKAVENHKKWVDAAQKLGCHSIRVNTFGTNDPEIWKITVVDGLKKLSEYSATKNINVLCENHGWLSSDAPKLMDAIHQVNMPNCGTLPDFGNWCVKRKDGAQWGECEEVYPDKYEGIKMMLTAAKAVSAKSYDFDENGNETTLDYPRIIQLVKDSGYTGFIGVEYEGTRLSENEGILATKNLLLNSVMALK